MKMICLRYFVIIYLFLIIKCESKYSVSKRALLFPRTMVFQFTYGVSIPLVLPRRSIPLEFACQSNYNLPWSLSLLKTKVIKARKDGDSFDISRTTFYKNIVSLFKTAGIHGEQCLLRSICEIAEHPMHIHDDNLLEKIVHFVFTPSIELSSNKVNVTSQEDLSFSEKLIYAEQVGNEYGNCQETFSDCAISIVDMFTTKYTY